MRHDHATNQAQEIFPNIPVHVKGLVASRQHNRTYRSQFMTSTYLHVNCVVGVACAEAFANKNIARGDTFVGKPD